jgi:hypothetical protein
MNFPAIYQALVAGVSVLTKCANPSCGESFRYLDEGRLFRVEEEPLPDAFDIKDPEYFWLCSNCSERMTLRLDERARIATAPLAGPPLSGQEAHFVLLEKRQGVLLSAVNFIARDRELGSKTRPKAKAASAG